MNGHDFTLEQNTEARMMLAVARRGLAAAICVLASWRPLCERCFSAV